MTAYSQNTLNANKFVKMFDVMGTDKSWQVTILARKLVYDKSVDYCVCGDKVYQMKCKSPNYSNCDADFIIGQRFSASCHKSLFYFMNFHIF